jgi:hypothetical protein
MKGIPMQNQIVIEKINCFLTLMSPIIIEIVKTILQTLDFQVIEKGRGLDLVFSIKAEKKEAEFYLHNLFLEIATIDRDEELLRFDEGLRGFDYFLAKMARLIQSKLNVLFQLLGQEDVDAAIESITKDAKQYERIRIWRFDSKPTVEK